ncbi:hypothetical protein [Mastigocoleus testarum]|uniref:Uncharacterized protein n=1 Tax=Mastigocoleus testarum BC008 TaxID=371196 RepID=A0A0V7ZMZ7_9CYAN|nr:hypothetical protein [Mastigocoleus testarum]KST65901.1 hypothetical protein BC008_23275 [Mastigocoleus testarum BC008]
MCTISWTIIHQYFIAPKTPEEILSCYERGWKYKSLFNNLEVDELEFIKKIAEIYDSWLKVEL